MPLLFLGRASALVSIILQLARRAEGLSTEALSTAAASPPYQQLAFGTWAAGAVESGGWVDYYVVAQSDDESIEFEVVAESTSPAALSIYVNDASSPDFDYSAAPTFDSSGTPVLAPGFDLHAGESQRRDGANAAGLDADYVSHIGNETHRHFYAYVSQCYAMNGAIYFLSVYGSTYSNVPFQVRAVRTPAQLSLGSNSGRVCDGKYAFHYLDLEHHPSHGGIKFAVEKHSGALDEWYLTYESCAKRAGSNIYRGNLFGHGLTSSSRVLPQVGTPLDAGRYYVSVRSSLDMCGEYVVTLTNLTTAALAEASDEY